MKKKTCALVTACIVMLACGLLAACGNNRKTLSETAQEHSPQPSDTVEILCKPGADIVDTLRLNHQLFEYRITCQPDPSLPIFEDNQGQRFYQNRVNLTVLRDGEEVIHHTFVKDDFQSHVAENMQLDFREGMLLGMNCNREGSSAQRLCFWAVVGWSGEGPTFRVFLTPGSDKAVIETEHQREEVDADEIHMVE